jgi:phage-related protein
MAIAGQIEYEIIVNDSGLKKGLDDAKKETKSFADNLQDAGKTGAKALGKTLVAGAVSASVAIVKLTKDAIGSYAEYEQLSGGIEAMFGGVENGYEQIAKVNELASNAWKDLTMSQNEYFTSFSSAYPLMKADIEDQNKAIEQTNKLLSLESDLSNTFGYSIEQASTAINWALKGSFNYIDNLNLGIKGTQEGFLEASRSVGYMVDDVKDLTSEQILDILTKYAEKFGVVGRTGQEALGTIQGSMKMFKASWSNLMTGVVDDGADFNKLMDSFVVSAGALGKNLLPRIKTAISGVVQIVGTLAPEIIGALPDIIEELLPAIIEGARVLILAIVENLPDLLRIFIDNIDVIVQGIVDIIFALIPRLPEILILLVEAVVKAIISIISSLGDNIGKAFVGIFENGIKPFFEGVFSFFGDFADGALRAFDDFGKGIGQGLENIGQWFKDVFQGIWDFVTGVFRNIGNFFGGIWDGIKNVFTQVAVNIGDAVSGAFKSIVNTVLGFVEGIVNGVVNVINVFADGINWILGAVSGGNASIGRLSQVHFGRLATGGIVEARNGGQLILAGEGGQDEWVVPESKMADMIQKINEQGGTGGGITINIQGVFATSDAEQRAVAEQIFDKLQEINKSRMGAYL